jgi:hypothetical protein
MSKQTKTETDVRAREGRVSSKTETDVRAIEGRVSRKNRDRRES